MNWYKSYGKLIVGLRDFYNDCQSENLYAGAELYKKISKNEKFKNENDWFANLGGEFGVKSVDPIHLFASLMPKSADKVEVKERLNFYRSLLGLDDWRPNIEIGGCPSRTSSNMLSNRNHQEQDFIWKIFIEITEKGVDGLSNELFEKYLKWNKGNVKPLTVFLYWISSKNFIPLTNDVVKFLNFYKIQTEEIKSFKDYIELIIRIERYNNPASHKGQYGARGIFREITYASELLISKRKSKFKFSSYLARFTEDAAENLDDPKSKEGFGGFIRSEESEGSSREINEEEETAYYDFANLGCKLISLKIHSDCSDDLKKNLKVGTHYYFDQCIEFKEDGIFYYSLRDRLKYNKMFHGQNRISVNVSAIVGKNGSGKSTLIELFFAVINNLSHNNRRGLKTKGLQYVQGLDVELNYTMNGYLYQIHVQEEDIRLKKYRLENEMFVPINNYQKFFKKDFRSLFYTIAVNYSHYSLNSESMGTWINGLFHKNDSYQTPIVINPMRKRGNFNINREKELLNRRLVSNLLLPVEHEKKMNYRQITPKQEAKVIEFNLIIDSSIILFREQKIDGSTKEVNLKEIKLERWKLYKLIKDVFEFPDGFKDGEVDKTVIKELKRYIVKKLAKIALTYPNYSKYFNRSQLSFEDQKLLRAYLVDLKSDESHVTLKLKQAIMYWKHKDLWPREKKFELELGRDSDRLNNYVSKISNSNIQHFIPPVIFEAKIYLSKPDNVNGLVGFDHLSSGEQQIIHSIHSLVYHIKNLDSVNDSGNLMSYRSINIVLDEIELYYHPELQRKFIQYLVNTFERVELERVDSINVCLATHSPYILSDIDRYRVLRLEDGYSRYNYEKTFGANVHDLLTDKFFMSQGFMGEFARAQINHVIDSLKFHKESDAVQLVFGDAGKLEGVESESPQWLSKEDCEGIISSIGEPMLYMSMMELYTEAFEGVNSFIDEQISSLTQLKS